MTGFNTSKQWSPEAMEDPSPDASDMASTGLDSLVGVACLPFLGGSWLSLLLLNLSKSELFNFKSSSDTFDASGVSLVLLIRCDLSVM